MKTYTLFDLQDLKKFLSFCSYKYKDRVAFLTKYESAHSCIDVEKEMTTVIEHTKLADFVLFNNSLSEDIKDREKSLIQSEKRIKELKDFKEKIKNYTSLVDVFKAL